MTKPRLSMKILLKGVGNYRWVTGNDSLEDFIRIFEDWYKNGTGVFETAKPAKRTASKSNPKDI